MVDPNAQAVIGGAVVKLTEEAQTNPPEANVVEEKAAEGAEPVKVAVMFTFTEEGITQREAIKRAWEAVKGLKDIAFVDAIVVPKKRIVVPAGVSRVPDENTPRDKDGVPSNVWGVPVPGAKT